MGKFKTLTEKLHGVSVSFDLQEDLNNIEYLTEDQKKLWKAFGDTPLKIEGSAGLYKKGFINKNTRRYDKMKEWVDQKQNDVKEGKITGRIDHAKPGEANLTGTAFLYKSLNFNEETGVFSYSGHTLPNEYGKELKGYVVSGVYVGNSTCGKGKVENIEIDGKMIEDVVEFELEGIDFVKRPSNEYGRVETFENEEGGEDMTLEELKAKYPNLVEALEAEFGKKTLSEMKIGMEDFIAKYPDLWEKMVKEMMVRMEGFKPYNYNESFKEIKDTLKKLVESTISDTEEEKTEDVKTVTTEAIKVEETEEYKKIAEELNTYKEKEELAKVEKEKQEAIEEAVKDSEFSEQLKKTLAECKNAEEVKAKVVTTKTLIEEILSAKIKKEVSGRGLAENKEDLDLGGEIVESKEPNFGEDGL